MAHEYYSVPWRNLYRLLPHGQLAWLLLYVKFDELLLCGHYKKERACIWCMFSSRGWISDYFSYTALTTDQPETATANVKIEHHSCRNERAREREWTSEWNGIIRCFFIHGFAVGNLYILRDSKSYIWALVIRFCPFLYDHTLALALFIFSIILCICWMVSKRKKIK